MTKPVKITLYTTSRCPSCKQAAQFLRKHGVRFAQFDVEKNRRAAVEFQRQGGRSVPLILVGQRKLTGFDPNRLRNALQQSGVINS